MTGKARRKIKDLAHERAAIMLGLAHQSVGKSEARQRFFPLMKQLTQSPLAVEVMERDEGVAVMVSKVHFDALINKLWELLKPTPAPEANELMGCITIVGDLEEGSQRAAAMITEAIKKSANAL